MSGRTGGRSPPWGGPYARGGRHRRSVVAMGSSAGGRAPARCARRRARHRAVRRGAARHRCHGARRRRGHRPADHAVRCVAVAARRAAAGRRPHPDRGPRLLLPRAVPQRHPARRGARRRRARRAARPGRRRRRARAAGCRVGAHGRPGGARRADRGGAARRPAVRPPATCPRHPLPWSSGSPWPLPASSPASPGGAGAGSPAGCGWLRPTCARSAPDRPPSASCWPRCWRWSATPRRSCSPPVRSGCAPRSSTCCRWPSSCW